MTFKHRLRIVKGLVKYLGIMIDSELSWKHHTDFVCDKISRSVEIIAKMRHCIPCHLLLNLYLALIVPYLNYGVCVHRPTSIRYLSPRNIFFIESNCFPLQSLFFKQLSYLMYSGTPLMRPPLGHKILVVITRWSH